MNTYSGLALKKLGNGDGYRLIAPAGVETARPKGPADVAARRSIPIVTEKVLTTGKGKHKHIDGFEIELSRAARSEPHPGCREPDRDPDRPASRRAPRSAGQPPGRLQGLGWHQHSLTIAGKARIALDGRIVVIARSSR